MEVITGVERRRKWSQEEKLAVVGESLAEGSVVSEVARRHGISPQQLFGWRAKLRAETAATRAIAAPLFAPAILDGAVARATEPAHPLVRRDKSLSIEITLGSVVVRIHGALDARTLIAVLRAAKAAS
ncbi:MAG TPA: transposase [Casimicrobiaceae bacterium]|nr:transposase [Casimicrobiaceae bacterium]